MDPQYSVSILSVIILVGSVQGVFLSVVLMGRRKGPRAAHGYLAFFLLCFSLVTAEDALMESRLLLLYPHLAGITAPLVFLLGPLFFLYVRTLITGCARVRARDFLHALPFLVCLLLFSPIYFSSAQDKLVLLKADISNENNGPGFIMLGAIVQTLFYYGTSLLLLVRRRKSLKEYLSSIENDSFQWLMVVISIVGLLLLVWIAAFVFRTSFLRRLDEVVFPFCVYAGAYLSIRQRETTRAVGGENGRELTNNRNPSAGTRMKYERSGLSEEEKDRFAALIRNTMECKRLYRNPELTLSQMASLIGIHPHHLSQTLNERFKQNFFDFCNQYRVEEVMSDLADEKKRSLKILSIAFDAGFNSKAAFNSAFKKYSGMTPSQYRNGVPEMRSCPIG